MGELAEKMMRTAWTPWCRRDVDLACAVLARDDQVDQLRDQIFRELLTYMMGDSAVVFPRVRINPGSKEPRTHRRPRHSTSPKT